MMGYLPMTTALIVAHCLAITPELMLSAPQRSEAVPNPAGTIAYFTVSQYSFDNQSSSRAYKLLDLESGDVTDWALNSVEVTDVVWLPGTKTGILYINGTNVDTTGGVSIWVGDAMNLPASTLVASLNAPFSGLKVASTSSGDIHFLVNSLAYSNGTAYNPKLGPIPRHSGRLYSDTYPRHWDTWLSKQRYAVFAGTLCANSSYNLSDLGMQNLLQGINFTATRPESPVPPFGGSNNYDISPDGEMIAFVSKATHLSKANFTASYIYLGPFDGSSAPVAFNGPNTTANDAGHEGASGAPTFSPNSSKLAYIQQDGIYYESDRWKLYTLDVNLEDKMVVTSNWKGLASNWDRSPDGIGWAPHGESIFVSAEDFARERIFNIPLNASDSFTPRNLTGDTSVSAFSVLPDSSLLVSASAVWTSREYYTTTGNGEPRVLFSALDVDAELDGVGPDTFDEFLFAGSEGGQLHALIVKPSDFVANKTYPLAYIIHGGPQGAHENSWSTAFNPQVWADQGYVVVAPNPTGSFGYGQNLTDAIQGNWGSYPYEDLVLCWEYIDSHIPYIDTKHGIAAGPSYGGYMMNWMQGHDLGRKFKALVTHDGISNILAQYGTDELWFVRHDNNGSLWENREKYDRWNPLNHVRNWSTPHFVVHNSLDYRISESEGLALFNILQGMGVPSRFLNFPDESHGLLNPENMLFWYTEIFNWINYWSGVGGPLDDVAIGA
ncbi:Alpha/Beta hydrolase protein [Clohesyomyces aquaticus]|uniref:Dipeptidyl-peptidase V n=1 Tax=Clohesyomyces aquaticus TaxID=1231657 RepID=A0A1Y2A4I8_9PLEO|nr:Alpha/Beta hydrolase protein [Clohesyomyces aquaticus]